MINDKRAWAAALILLVIAGAAVWLSLPTYGKIGPRAYEMATALYSACNQRDSDRVEAVERLVQAAEDNDLSPTERRWLAEIIDRARTGHWQQAGDQTRQLMEAQVEGR